MAPGVLAECAPAWRDANACPACARSGYRGRFGVFEVTKIDSELQEAIRQRASEPELIAHARRHGFRTLFENAMRKARAGATTFSEAFRVVSS